MRLKIRCKPHKQLILPIHYQQILQGFIYSSIKDEIFSEFLHKSGFFNGKRNFKLFTFSRLEGKYEIDYKSKKIIFKEEVVWYISSILPEFIQEVGNTLLTSNSLQLNNQPIEIIELSYNDSKNEDDIIKVKTISPITIYSTYETGDGKKITQYFGPSDPVFSYLIEENMKKKFVAFFNKELDNSGFSILPIKIGQKDKVITRFKGTIINAWSGIYELRGNPTVLDFAYKVGVGGRNSQGFGMVKLL